MVGQKDFMIDPGRHVYEIVYELDRSVVCNDKNSSCELLWNVNGNDCDLGIDSLVAKVYLPNNSKIENFNAWVGKYGSEESEDFESYAINESAHTRSEEHTSELQSRPHLVCRLLLEKKKKKNNKYTHKK